MAEIGILDSFIPIPAGLQQMLKGEPLLSNLLGQIGYEAHGKDIIFTSDITVLGINYVQARLIVADVSTLGDFDLLPIPADMEIDIIKEVLGLLMARGQNDGLVDSGKDSKGV